MIEMNFKQASNIRYIRTTTRELTKDTLNKLPTGLYGAISDPSEPKDYILYFGYGVWVRNQEACNAASYDIQYLGPVSITVHVEEG